MTIVFFGTSEFAVPALKMLAADPNYKIVVVITQPDKPAGREQTLSPTPVKLAAEKLRLKVSQPSKLEIENWKLKIPQAEVYVVASYGKIIPKEIIEQPKYGTLNIHPSLLPRYRGPSPIQAAILNGDHETGVTIMKLDEEMDHGPVLASRKFKVQSGKFKKLHDELAEIGAELLIEILPKYINGEIKPVEQDHLKATFTKIITKEDGRIDWTRSAEEIDRQIRAYETWPVAWTTLDGKRLKIFEATPSPREERGGVRLGSIEITDNNILVQCGQGLLQILELQLEGSKKITARELANGYRDLEAKRLN